MRKIFLLFLTINLFGCDKFSYIPKQEDEMIKIVVLSDPHYISSDLVGDFFYEEQKLSDGKLSIYIEELMDCFVYQMKEEKPDLVVVTGDLTYNGAAASHKDLSDKFKELKKNNIQTLVIPGNHDILNVHSTDYSKDVLYNSPFINVDDYKEIYESYGYDGCLSKDENSLSYLYEAGDRLWLLMLDSNTYEKNSSFAPSSEGYIKQETIDWIANALQDKPENTKVLAFMHHPILDQAGATSYVTKNSRKVLESFNEQNIDVSFSGHVHVQNFKDNGNHINVSVSSIAVYDHQYTVVEYNPNDTLIVNTVNLDFDSYLEESKIKDPFFDDFENNAYEYFKKYSTTRLVGAYEGDGVSTELANRLLELKGIANAYQFKGEGYKFKEILESDPYYDKILEHKKDVASSLFSMLNYNKEDATHLEIILD